MLIPPDLIALGPICSFDAAPPMPCALGLGQSQITLIGDAWQPSVGRQESDSDHAVARALLDGIVPSLTTAGAWASVVAPALTTLHVSRAGPQTVVVTLPQALLYDIAEPETLTVAVPGVALRSGQSIVATPQLRILASNGTLEVRGSLLASPTEATIREALEPPTIQLDVLEDAWVPGLGEMSMINGTLVPSNAEASMSLLRNLRSQQSEPSGWGAVVQAALRPLDIRRLTNSSIEITLPEEARKGYAITRPETIMLTAPEASLLSGRQVVGLPEVVILPTPGSGHLSNSLVSNNSETDVQGGGMQITITLSGDTWAPSIGQRGSGGRDSLTEQVLRAFISAQDEDGGWNAVVQKALQYTELSYVDGASITLTLPSFPAYDLLKAETVSCNIPPAAVASGQEIFAGIGASQAPLQISANTGTIRLSGNLFGAANETTLRSVLSYQIIITLTGDTWTQGVGQQDETGEGASAQLLRGFTSQQDEPYGWNSIVRPGIPQKNVERTTDFTVTITVDQFAAYEITEPETIEVVVPPIAVSSAQIVQAPSFVVLPIKGSATLRGKLVEEPTEDTVTVYGFSLTITLVDDTFSTGVGVDASASQALARGLRSLQDEPAAWNSVVIPELVASEDAVVRLSDTEVMIHLPPIYGYAISYPETLVVSIPASAVSSKQRLVAQPARGLVIFAQEADVRLGGTLYPTAQEDVMRAVGGNVLAVMLTRDSFSPSVALPGEASEALLAGIRSVQSEPRGFNAMVAPALKWTDVSWSAENASTILITLPQVYRFDISAPETVTVVVPAAACRSSRRAMQPATLVLHPTRPIIRLSGGLLDRATDEGVRSAEPSMLELHIDGDDLFLPTLGQPQEPITTELLASLVVTSGGVAMDRGGDAFAANQTGSIAGDAIADGHPALVTRGWMSASTSLRAENVELMSATFVRISIPQMALYRPQVPETLSVTVPSAALRSGRATPAESQLVLASGSTSGRLLGPSLLDTPYEGLLQSQRTNLTVRLSGDRWRHPLDPALVLSGLRVIDDVIDASQHARWNAQFSAAAARGEVNVTALDAHAILIDLPALPSLRLEAPEAVTVTVPAAATMLGHRSVVCNPQLVLRPRQARLSGSLLDHATDAARIRSANHELLISLEADEFVSGVGSDVDATMAVLAGLGSGLRDGLSVHQVERLDARRVRIAIPAQTQSAYDIEAPETVTVALPASVLASNVSMQVTPAFVVRPVPGEATWYTFDPNLPTVRVGEEDLQQSVLAYRTRVDLQPLAERWVPELGGDNAATRAFLHGFLSSGAEAAGFNQIVRAALAPSAVYRVNDHRVEVDLSGHAAFDISAPETVQLAVAAAAVVSGRASLAGGPSFVIRPVRGSASLSGTLLASPFERTMQSVEGGQLQFALNGDGFVDTLGQTVSQDDACTGSLIDMLALRSGLVPQPLGWGSVVQATLRNRLDSVVVRESREILQIQLPQLLVYKLSTAETITTSIPGACLLSGNALQEQRITGAPFRVLPAVGRAYLSGSLLTQAFESTVQTTASQLTINLYDDILLDGQEALVPQIISGSLGSLPGSWNQIVQAGLSASDVTIVSRDNGFDITVDIQANPAYSITEPETVQVVIPAGMVASEQSILASPAFVIEVAGARGTRIEGSVTEGLTEGDMRSGSVQNLTIELIGDTWLNGLPSQGLIDGLVSGQAEPGGWTSVVRPTLSAGHLHVLRNTTMALYFRGGADYDISAPETVAVEVPARTTSSGQDPPIVTSFRIAAEAGSASLSGSFLNASRELEISGPETHELAVSLVGNTFPASVGNDKWASRAVLDSLRSAQDEPSGWNAIVRQDRLSRYLVRQDDASLLITLPQHAAYEISSPETLFVQLPASLVSAEANLTSPDLLIIRPRPGRASISGGDLVERATEREVRYSSTSIELMLVDEVWRHDLATNTTAANGSFALSSSSSSGVEATRLLFSGMRSQQTEPGGWNSQVLPLLVADGRLVRVSDTRLTITVPSTSSYAISAPETVSLVVPSEAVVSRVAPLMDLPAFVIRPTRGYAELETPHLRNEGQVRAGSGTEAIDLTRTAREGLADVSGVASFVSMNITLEDDEWSDSLLEYVDEEFEVCVYEQQRNVTPPRLLNVSICAPSPNATNTTNGTCAYAGNGTNASVPSTWAFGFPYRREVWVDGETGVPLRGSGTADLWYYLPDALRQFLSIGGASWQEARRFGVEALPPRPWWETEHDGLSISSSLMPPTRRLNAHSSDVHESSHSRMLQDAHAILHNNTNTTNATNASNPCTLYVRRVYSDATRKLIQGIVSAQLEDHGWMRAVQPQLTGDMLRRNGSTLTLTLPPQLSYNIRSPELLSLKLPREALRSGRPLTANNTAPIDALGGRIGVSGSFLDALREEDVQSPETYTLVFSLEGESWDPEMSHDGSAASAALLHEGIYSEQSEAGGWNAVVRPLLAARHLKRHDDETITLTLPPVAAYEISQPETYGGCPEPPSVRQQRGIACASPARLIAPHARVSVAGCALWFHRWRFPRARPSQPT